jgi:hypothetical protein
MGTPSHQDISKAELASQVKKLHERIVKLEGLLDESRWVEESLRNRTRQLNERIKELECLYAISDRMKAGLSGDQLFQEIAELLPRGWQRPDSARARIVLGGREYRSAGFQQSVQSLSTPVTVGGKQAGFVEVVYVGKNLPEPLFMKEEQHLLEAVASWLSEIESLRPR